MANPNSPFGFRPLLVDLEGAPVGTRQYAKPASDATAIFSWDMLIKVAGGSASETGVGNLVPQIGR